MPNDIDAAVAELRRRQSLDAEQPNTADVDSAVAELRRSTGNTSQQEQNPEPVTPTVPSIKPVNRQELALDSLDLSLRHASTSNPAAEAERRNLASRLGVDKQMVPDPETARQELFLKENDPAELLRTNPEIAKYLEDLDNATIAGQDISTLKSVTGIMRRLAVDPLVMAAKTTVAVPQSLAGVYKIYDRAVKSLIPDQLTKAVDDATPQQLREALGATGASLGGLVDFKQTQDFIEQFYSPETLAAKAKVQKAQGFFDTVGTALENPSSIVTTVGESIGPMLLGGAAAQTIIKAFPALSPLVAGAIGEGVTIAGSTAQGMTEDTGKDLTGQQALLSVGAGALGAGIGVLGGKIMQKMGVTDIDTALAKGTLDKALRDSKMPQSLIARVTAGAVGEGVLEEMPQSAIEQIAHNVGTGKPWDEGVENAMAMGMLAGAATGGTIQAFTPKAPNEGLNKAIDDAAVDALRDVGRAQQAADNKQTLEEFSKAVSNSSLRKNSPEEFKKFVRTMADEGQMIEEVYVDPKTLNEAFAQSEITPEEIAEKMPELAKEMQVAEQAGTDVRISFDDYATYIAGSKAETGIIDHLRTSPEGMTYSESQLFQQDQTKILTEQAKKILDENQPVLTKAEFMSQNPQGDYKQYQVEHQNKREVFAVDAQQVHDDLLEGLNKAGRFNRDANAVYAVPFREFYATAAAKEGILPSELYKRMPLNFQNVKIEDGLLDQASKVPGTPTYHGSNVKFDSFDLSHFGEGEGGGSFGFGVHLTEDAGVATSYGKEVYETRILPKEEEFLLWDKPLKEQSELIQDIIENNNVFEFAEDVPGLNTMAITWNKTAAELYEDLHTKFNTDKDGNKISIGWNQTSDADRKASEYLASIGIKGIKYGDNVHEGVTNYTVFSPDDVAIVPPVGDNDPLAQTQLRTPDAQQTNNFGNANGRARTIAGLPPQQGFEQQTKIRGRDGTPLTVFRGSKAGLSDAHFEKAALGFTSGAAPSGRGVHFTTTRDAAQVHGDVREFQLDIRKPYVFKADDESIPSHDTAEEYFEWREGLRAQGFDGIVEIASHLGGPNTIIAFDPQQVIEKPGVFFQFAGQQARTANTDSLAKAEQLIKDGATPESVRTQTGWHQGVDGGWRFEISDNEASLTKSFLRKLGKRETVGVGLSTLREQVENQRVAGRRKTKLITVGDLINHTKLFEAYPQFKDMPVFQERVAGHWAYFSLGDDIVDYPHIKLGPDVRADRVLSTLIHELQHAIQNEELFAFGGNPQLIEPILATLQDSNPNKAKLLDVEAYEAYRRLFGEVEARNTQARLSMSDEDRILSPVESTEDIPKEDQVIISKDELLAAIQKVADKEGVSASLPPPANLLAQSAFYSALSREIGGLKKIANKQGMVKPEQAIQWITARQKEGKFKQAEVDAVGVLDWLSATKEPVSVSDVEQFVQANGIQIEETVLADVFDDEFLELEDTHFFEENEDGQWQVFGEHADESDVFETQSEAEDRLNEILGELRGPAVEGESKFGDYVLPGGENYRELLMRLPVRGQSFKSSHFDQENIVAHVRLNEREADGNKVLFIEEIQSDWAQEGRKKGFADTRLRRRAAAMQEVFIKKYPNTFNTLIENWSVKTLTEAGVPHNLASRYMQMALAPSGVPQGPFLENTKDWTALAFKRMLRYAAEGGFDKIAWTTGEQQADRYSLARTVTSVQYTVKKSGEIGELNVFFGRGEDAETRLNPTKEYIEEVLGKKLAARVLNREGEEISHRDTPGITIKDLGELNEKVGGEGMIAYYDNIVPQVVADVMKKLKGPKAAQTEIDEIGAQPSIDITSELRAKVMEGLPLFQDQSKVQNRAAYDPTNFTISLLKGADLSSVIHEGGHFYLEALADMASQPQAIQQVKDDFRKTLNWFGINGPDPEGLWRLMTLDQKRQYHEQWAQSFERYALEGKSPTLDMQPVFARFRRWMLSVYKSLKEFLKQNPLAGKLNDDVRQIFDRLLAADDAIKEAEKAREYAPLFANANDAGVTDAEFQTYMEQGKEATELALDELGSRSLKDMQWLSGAKSREIKKLQRQADAKRKVIRQEVMDEVLATPVHRAMTFLRSGKITRDDGSVETLKEHKLNSDDIRDIRPGMDLRSLPGMTKPDGLDPDFAAQLFGFESGDALLTAILTEPKAAETIRDLTDKRMLEEHGDLVDPESISRAADKAIHNEARARFTATGLKMLMKSPANVRDVVKAAKQAAESVIEAKKIRDLNPNQFTMAEKRANKEAIKFAGKQDNKRAIEAQRAALINNKLFVAARDAKDEVEKAIDFLKKFDSPAVRKKLDIDYLEQIDDLKAAFDLRKGVSVKALDKRQSLADWIDEQEANGFEPAIDPALMDELKRKHYKDMTMGEIRGLVDSIKQIERLARMKKELLTAKDKKEFQARVDEADEAIRDNANRTVPERGTPTDVVGITAQWMRKMAAMHRKFNSIIREMDGGKDNGTMWNLLARPMNEAGDLETEMKQVAATKIAELFKDLPKDATVAGNLYAKKRMVPGTNLSMTHEQRIMFAMNWGNEGNRQRLLDGGITGRRALSIKEADAVLDTLTKEEWDFVQGVWDYIGTYKDQIKALEKRLTGVEPEWVDPTPVKTEFGTYAGGYFPAKYDTELSSRSESLEAVTDLRMGMKGAFQSAAARNGYTKARADQVINRPLLLSYNVISQHVSEVTHRLAWQPWLIDANRLLKALDAPIREHYGAEILRELRDTVVDIAQGDAPAKNATEQAINRLRKGSTVVGMGWRFTTAAMQVAGLTQSWSRIGTRWIAAGAGQYMASPLKSSEFVNQKSKLMKDRGITMQREINEVLNTIRAGEKVSALTASYFTLIGKMQRTVDIPTWLGAYEKGLHGLKYQNATDEKQRKDIEDHAAALADQAVLDAQSGGQIKDLAKVQRGSPAWKLFTNFYSYFSAAYNLNIEAVRRTSFKSPSQVGLLAADMILINILPIVFAVAVKNMFKGGCEWDDVECFADKYAQEQISHFMGQNILLREAGAAVSVATGGGGYGYQGPAGLRFFGDLYKAGAQINQGEADMALFKAVNSTAGALLHYPAGQINATVEGIMAVERGDVEGISILPALLAGPPRD